MNRILIPVGERDTLVNEIATKHLLVLRQTRETVCCILNREVIISHIGLKAFIRGPPIYQSLVPIVIGSQGMMLVIPRIEA